MLSVESSVNFLRKERHSYFCPKTIEHKLYKFWQQVGKNIINHPKTFTSIVVGIGFVASYINKESLVPPSPSIKFDGWLVFFSVTAAISASIGLKRLANNQTTLLRNRSSKQAILKEYRESLDAATKLSPPLTVWHPSLKGHAQMYTEYKASLAKIIQAIEADENFSRPTYFQDLENKEKELKKIIEDFRQNYRGADNLIVQAKKKEKRTFKV